jgi:hypothetical protein
MLTWNDAFFARYDSPWCVLEKLSWLNVKKPFDIVQHVAAGPVRPSPYAADDEDSYIDTSWLHVRRPRHRDLPERSAFYEQLAHNIDARCGRRVLGFVAPAMLTTQLKVCHDCLALGYHSVVHQIEGLRICPIHDSPLSEACPHCRHTLPSFSVRGASSQFKCGRCGATFLKDGLLEPPSDEIREGERQRIEPFIHWINGASREPMHWPSWSPEWRFREDGETGYRLTTFQASLPQCLNAIHPWPFAHQYFGASAAGLELVPIEEGSALCTWDDSPSRRVGARANRACAEMKAFAAPVARGAESDILDRLKAHHSCIKDVIDMAASKPDGAAFEFSANPAMCGVAQSFIIWQSRLQTFIDALGLWARRGWVPCLNENLTNILRIEMESSFYYGANQVACLQAISTLTMGQRYGAIRSADSPCFAKPQEPIHNEKGFVDVRYIFRLKDEGIFRILRCDHGRYRQNRLKDMNILINEMVSSVHSLHTK